MPDPSYTTENISKIRDIIAELFQYPDVAALHRNTYDGGKWYDTITYVIPRMRVMTAAEIKTIHVKNYGDAIYMKVATMPHQTRTIDALADFITDFITANVSANLQEDVVAYVSNRVETAGLVYTPPPPPPTPVATLHLPYRQRIIRAAMESFKPEMYAHIRMEPVHMPEIELSLRSAPAPAPAPSVPDRVRAWTEKLKFT